MRLDIFNAYDGIDMRHTESELAAFGEDAENIWTIIENKIQDIYLINRHLSSNEYTRKTLEELEAICDKESFKELTGKIDFYKHFQIIADILLVIKKKTNADTYTFFAGFDNIEMLEKEMENDIINIRYCNFETLEKVQKDFLPTCTYQELSLPNGWADEYITLASHFDMAYSLIVGKRKTQL
jgi:hypothetical protein